MANERITTAGHEVVFSYDFMTFDDSPCQIITRILDSDITINLSFLDTNDSPADASVDFRTDDSGIFFEFINFNNNLGSGNIDPFELGSINDRKLFIRYWIAKLGTKTDAKHVFITIYIEGGA